MTLNTKSLNYEDAIENATVYGVSKITSLDSLPKLSIAHQNTLYLKREDQQPVFSFKCRGAFNKMSSLSPETLQSGVIAASAGNHAQGVALSAQKLGCKALIVMPTTTPQIKVQNVKNYGADVVLYGDSYDEAYTHALQLSKEKDLTFIHPYDDPDVIAGQGTIAKEILDQLKEPIDYIFVAVGGGGLIAGIGAYIKAKHPETKIIGVEPENAACLTAALEANERVVLDQVGIFADGVAVKQVGEEPFRLAKLVVDDMVTVTTDEICAGIKDIYDETRSIAEPAGALGLAGLKKYIKEKSIQNKTIVTLNCGANINFDRLRHVSERAEIGEEKEALFAVTIPEEKGSFDRFCQRLGKRAITEFNYRYTDSKEAYIFVGVELSEGRIEREALVTLFQDNGFTALDLTDNELAKLHTRHMVGGHADTLQDERLFRVQFPERPGALMGFLKGLGSQWNISLFHYRNHGAAFGRVLMGVQVPDSEIPDFQTLLDQSGMTFFDESDNPAYHLFLK